MEELVIIGSGISAYLAALAASPHCKNVTILSPIGDVSPKTKHAHVVPAGTWKALRDLIPDLIEGVPKSSRIDAGAQIKFVSPWGTIPQVRVGIECLSMQPSVLLALLNKCAMRRKNIAIKHLTRSEIVRAFVLNSSSYYVIASGFNGPISEKILKNVPKASVKVSNIGPRTIYSTFNIRLSESRVPKWSIYVRDYRVDNRFGLLIQIDQSGHGIFSVVTNTNSPIRSVAELKEYLNRNRQREILKLLADSEEIGDPVWYRFPGIEAIRHVQNAPNVCLFGDTAAVTDPYFGHGIFVAALSAHALARALTENKDRSLVMKRFKDSQNEIIERVLANHRRVPKSEKRTLLGTLGLLKLRISRTKLTKLIMRIHLINFYDHLRLSILGDIRNEENSEIYHDRYEGSVSIMVTDTANAQNQFG